MGRKPTNLPTTTIGWLLFNARTTHGMTREELALASGVSLNMIRCWETGSIASPKAPHLFVVTNALDLDDHAVAVALRKTYREVFQGRAA